MRSAANRFFDNRIPPPLDFADLTKLLCGNAGSGMRKPRDPGVGVDNVASAMDLTARVAAAVVAMVGPGLAGQWLDQRWGTGFLALLGFLFGIPFGVYYLLETSRSVSRQRGTTPRSQPPSETTDTSTDDHDRPSPSDE